MTLGPCRMIAYLFLALVSGCVPRQPPEPEAAPLPTPKVLVEEDIVVDQRADLSILDIDEQREAQGDRVIVTGTVVNRGPGKARNLTVTVSALDESGSELLTLPAEVGSSVLEPNSSTKFSVRLHLPPGTVRYHVVAQSR